MATTSFDKVFFVTDKSSIEKFNTDAILPVRVTINKDRDYNSDRLKGIELLKQQLSNLVSY